MMDFIKYGTLSRTRLWFARLLRLCFVRLLQGCFILCLLCTCTREYPPFGSPNQGNGHRGESGPFRPDYLPSGQDSAQISSKSLYLCGVRYPDGYDWVKDEQKGSVPASLFLLKDGELIYECPTGIQHGPSTDADMHRILQGRLYMDYATDSETVMRCENEELYRVQGREYIRGVLPLGQGILTLCQPRNRSGEWVLRNDGVELKKGTGEILGNLYYRSNEIGGSLSAPQNAATFVFSTQGDCSFSLYENLTEPTTYYIEENPTLYAAGLVNAFPWIAYREAYENVIINLAMQQRYSFPVDEKWVDLKGSPDYLVLLSQLPSGGAVLSLFSWMNAFFYEQVVLDEIPIALAVGWDPASSQDNSVGHGERNGSGASWYVLAKNVDGTQYKIITPDAEILLPQGARPYSKNCFWVYEGKIYLSLIMDGKAAFYADGKISQYSFNGYVDGMELGP